MDSVWRRGEDGLSDGGVRMDSVMGGEDGLSDGGVRMDSVMEEILIPLVEDGSVDVEQNVDLPEYLPEDESPSQEPDKAVTQNQNQNLPAAKPQRRAVDRDDTHAAGADETGRTGLDCDDVLAVNGSKPKCLNGPEPTPAS
ncbi:Armadillo repeat-containing protein 1 [Collichthys lucidus]|uniref:Armadillo repeat-containing protein 1 n=1 Tax=Collichthys lucidus TaxID=240159 RepID=A0A4U5UX44_COLLU|nr:Armadillo repeat-containing protein 1 [Collichthys lucidus]